jgi:hypothetical protein
MSWVLDRLVVLLAVIDDLVEVFVLVVIHIHSCIIRTIS